MKNLIFLVVIAAAGYFGYTYWQKLHPATAEMVETAPAPEMVPGAPASPVAPPASVAPPVVPHVPNLAPAGTWFLLTQVAVTTDSGVVGKTPGTQVKQLAAVPAGLRVTDGHDEFTVSAMQVTNDVDVARRILDADRATQARLVEARAAQSRPATIAAVAPSPATTPGGLFAIPAARAVVAAAPAPAAVNPLNNTSYGHTEAVRRRP